MSKKPFLWQVEDIAKPKALRHDIHLEEIAIWKVEGGKKHAPIYRLTEPMERKGFLGNDVQKAIIKLEHRKRR